jgi:peroxin-19
MESLVREMGGLGVDGGVLDGAPGISGGAGAGAGATGTGAGTGKKTEKDKEQERAFKAAWEAMLVEGMDGMVSDEFKPGPMPAFTGVSGNKQSAGTTGKEKEEARGTKQDFQAGIQAAFEKLKSSESGFKVLPLPLNK